MSNTPIGGTLATSVPAEGLAQPPWWVEQWMELINSYRFKKRLERAWTYVREGNVVSIRFEGRRVHARVQGTEPDPYKVKLWLDVLNDEDWNYVLDALAEKARWSAQLLAGIMPSDIERAFAASGKRLFPFKLQEVRSECTCPDKASPCKHASAIYYLMGDRFSEDPFVLFQLRGRTRAQLLDDLAQRRREKQEERARKRAATGVDGEEEATIQGDEQAVALHSALQEPQRWWQYGESLDPDLVVITPAMEGGMGLDQAGELPLAAEARHPDANRLFRERITRHSQVMAAAALDQAMGSGNP